MPVVAPRAGGAPTWCSSLETGLLYDPADAHGLPRAVSAVAGDRHRALLGARAASRRRRDWPAAVDELVERHYAPWSVHRTAPRAA